MKTPLLTIENLETCFLSENGNPSVLNGVNLEIMKKSRHALIGQTGSGKSVLGLSILKLLPENAKIDGRILFKGRDLLTCENKTLRRIRGKSIMMIFQNPFLTMNPLLSIEKQLCEIPMYHEGISRSKARRRAEETLDMCGLRDPKKIMSSYPHEMSGGMLQRVAVTMGVICRPELLIADEPLKGLDVGLQKQLTLTLYKVCRELSLTLLLITHNLKVAESLCDRISVMYEGNITETRSVQGFFSAPGHAYSRKLVNAYDQYSKNGPKTDINPSAKGALAC